MSIARRAHPYRKIEMSNESTDCCCEDCCCGGACGKDCCCKGSCCG